ncbi:uncharacterized protein LOC117155029 [Bombus vancouverensis nearcticus]|uniref:uncharacterized protein LOC117155029 n=1 Tax=Bombus vancouverensis nearcticus TaxID=2705178 RepID=UPI00402BDDD9
MSQRRAIPTISPEHSPEGGGSDLDGLFFLWECPSFCDEQRRRLLACISGTITMCLVGTVYGWTNSSFLPLTTGIDDVPLRLTYDEYSWSVSLTVLSSMIGSLLAAHLADRIGRKYCLIACSITFTLGWLHMYFATSVRMLYFARGILGIGVGIARTINPMFLSEVADIKLRGRLGTLIAANVHFGTLLGYIPGLALTYTSHLLAIVGISAISILPLIYIRETPYFLVAKGQEEQACKSIAYYKGIEYPDQVRVELRALRAEARYGLHQQSTSDLHSQSRSSSPPPYNILFPPQSIRETHSDTTQEVVGTEATSDLNLPSSSDSHSQSITSVHSKFKCEVRKQATGELRVEYSRVSHGLPLQTTRELHSQSASDLYRPSTSQIHRPPTSQIHPDSTCEIHQASTSEKHPEATCEIYPETTSEILPETTNDIYRPSTSQINRPSTSEIPPEITREIHPEATSEIHPETISGIHQEATSEIHPEATSETHPETTSEIHPEATSEIHPETTRGIHPETTNEIHRPSTSQIHRPSISQIFPETRSELHSRARSDLRTQFRVDSQASTDISEPYMDLTKYTCLEKLRAILQRSNRRALFIMLGLIMAQHLSGNFTATQYLENIISRNATFILGYSDMICLEIVRLLSSYLIALRVDSCGRRKLLIMSATGTIYISFLLTFYFYSPKHSSIDSAMSFIPISHFLLYQVVFHIGLGVLPNVFLCDLFPTKLKGIVGAIVVIFDGIIGFTASKLTQVITDNIGVFGNYAFFWISCLMALAMMFVWVPETGGKTYREIEELLLRENFNFLDEEVSTDEMDSSEI